MRFEPLLFIRMAQENGIELTRIERNIRIINASTLWTAAIKKHKRQLLRHLPEDQVKRLQLDLFDDDRPPG
jgi:hypothetical protein